MRNYKGVIIEESLKNNKMPEGVRILSTEVEDVTDNHKTLWLKKWTLHIIEVEEGKGLEVANIISNLHETKHGAWYADYKNDKIHYIIYPGKVFKIANKNEYKKAKDYGLSLGIPDYQLNFEEMK